MICDAKYGGGGFDKEDVGGNSEKRHQYPTSVLLESRANTCSDFRGLLAKQMELETNDEDKDHSASQTTESEDQNPRNYVYDGDVFDFSEGSIRCISFRVPERPTWTESTENVDSHFQLSSCPRGACKRDEPLTDALGVTLKPGNQEARGISFNSSVDR